MSETTEIEVPSDLVEEVGHGILQRAQDIHENPDDEHEETAERLRELGQDLAL